MECEVIVALLLLSVLMKIIFLSIVINVTQLPAQYVLHMVTKILSLLVWCKLQEMFLFLLYKPCSS